MMEGYFVISRKLLEDDMYLGERFSRGQAWIDLIGLAAFKDTATYVRKIRVLIPRGCVAKSMHDLANRWQWDVHTVSRFLNHLQEIQQIHIQKSNVTTLISIINYEKYQFDAHTDLHADAHTNAHANAHAPIIENKDKINLYTQNACTCVRDSLGEEIVLTDIWIEEIQRFVYSEFGKTLTPEDVTRAFNKFAIEKQAREDKIYRQDFKSHFATWIRTKIQEQNDKASKDNKDRRRSAEVTATSEKDYEGGF